MKIVFWNIGPRLSTSKEKILENIKTLDADIICFAEGGKSNSECDDLIKIFESIGYDIYYTPKFVYDKNIFPEELGYNYNILGLVVFIRTDKIKINSFAYTEQRVEGRIICLDVVSNNKKYFLFFVHAPSMVGDDITQTHFMLELDMFISLKMLALKNYSVIVIGDFNKEPWDKELRISRYINSFFYRKEFQYYLDNINIGRFYFNPFFEYIHNNSQAHLIGTYYNSSYTCLLDYALFSPDLSEYKILIVDSINGINLFKEKTKSRYELIEEFDHLPIQITLK